MTIVLGDGNTIKLIGVCPVDDAETLLQLLLDNPGAKVDWRGCESAHVAVIQVLLVARRPPQGPPAGDFLNQIVAPAVAHALDQV